MDAKRQRELAENVGRAIAAKRMEVDMTQDELAAGLGIGSEAVSRMERGVVVPSAVRLFEFADALGCRIDELLLGASDRADDHVELIARRVRELRPVDRQFVADLVGQLADHLSRPERKKSDRDVF